VEQVEKCAIVDESTLASKEQANGVEQVNLALARYLKWFKGLRYRGEAQPQVRAVGQAEI
jgi:hypothetical protein